MGAGNAQIGHQDQRQAAIDGLLTCADAQERGEFRLIEQKFDTFERALPQSATQIPDDVLIAFNFWDAWADASNHDWQFYEPIGQRDWPRLAREIVAHLQDRTMPVDPVIWKIFPGDLIRPPWYVRAWQWFRGSTR